MKPKLEIDSGAIINNLKSMKALTAKHGISMSVVTKGLVGYEPLVSLLAENGADSICESHLENLVRFKDIAAEKWMIRSPLLSETSEVVRYADVSLVSEKEIIKSLSEAAVSQDRKHKVVIMLELGELREGCMPEEIIPLCETCLSLPGIDLYGIGAHISSFIELVPDEYNMGEIVQAAERIESTLGIKLPLISAGSTVTVKMLQDGTLPKPVNHLRFGEAVILGTIACYDVPFEGASTGTFNLYAEVFEVKEKPSMPWGDRAPCALSIYSDPRFHDIGIRKRALIAVGKQDVRSEYLIPHDPNLIIIGDTSDCLIADVTDCEKDYKPGDILGFGLRYHGVVTALASDYIDKALL